MLKHIRRYMNYIGDSNMRDVIKEISKPAYLSYRYATSKRKIKTFIKDREKIFLELGAGNKKGENGWLTLDMTKKCDIFWDLRKGIPFPDKSISEIYSSHLLEHLTFEEGQKLLDECLRVLISGGIFSICVPNAKLFIENYLNSEVNSNNLFRYKPAYNDTTKIDYINYIAYMDGQHKYMFDEENLVHILKLKGMKNVRLREFDPNLDLEERDSISIYAIAEK